MQAAYAEHEPRRRRPRRRILVLALVAALKPVGTAAGHVRMPAGTTVQSAQWAPRGDDLALIRRAEAADRSEVLLLSGTRSLRGRVLFTGPGRFGAFAWAPPGDRLLVGWPAADQWLFLRPRREGRLAAVASIARQFTPGAASPSFPSTVQWCCGTPDP